MQNADKIEKKELSRSALRRQREKEQRYKVLLTSAETLIVKNGYHKTSVGQIADHAEVSVGTVYFYFKNKEELLIKLFEEGVKTLRHVLGSAFLKEDNSLKGFENAGLAFFDDFCINHRPKFTILFKEALGLSPEMETQRKETLELLINDVTSALKIVGDEMNFSYRTEQTARVVTVGILGIYERVAYQYIMWQDDTNTPNLEEIGKDAVAFIMGGINSLTIS